MALLNQDFIKFDYDTFQIKFTITDATTDLSTYSAWWGVSSAATDTSLVVQKATTDWAGFGVSTGISMGNSSATVSLGQADFGGSGLESGTTCYHELVLSATGSESDSVVVASGDFTVNPSLFTSNTYRP